MESDEKDLEKISRGLKRYWTRQYVSLAVKKLRKLPKAVPTTAEEAEQRKNWEIAYSAFAPLFLISVLIEKKAPVSERNCALAALKGFFIGAGTAAITKRALCSQVRIEAEKLELRGDERLDAFYQMITQAYARVNKQNRMFYTGVYFAAGGPQAVGSAESWQEFRSETSDQAFWLKEAVVMIAGLHAYLADERDRSDFLRRAYAKRCHQILDVISWRPNIGLSRPEPKRIDPYYELKRPKRDVRASKTLEMHLLGKDGGAEGIISAVFAYAAYSLPTENGSNALNDIIALDVSAEKIAVNWVEICSRAMFILKEVVPEKMLRSHARDHVAPYPGKEFAHPQDISNDDLQLIAQLMSKPGKGRKAKSSDEAIPVK